MIDLNEQISEHFTMREMCYSATASAKGWPNVCGPVEADNLRRLVSRVLQPLRNHLGQRLTVSSGYRTQRVNRYVGGANNSMHLSGCAADVRTPDWETCYKAAAYVCRELPFTECIVSHRGLSIWLHLAYDPASSKRYVGYKQYR